jgi:hypothetical protein
MILSMRVALFAILLLTFAGAHAVADVLVSPLPAGVDGEKILQMTRDVLSARGWELIPEDASTIEARKTGIGLRIFIADNALRFSDRAQTSRTGRNRDRRGARVAVAEEEIDALRTDLAAAFAGNPPVAGAAGRLLLGDLPRNLSDEQILRVVWSALAGRRWVVQPGDGDTVVAELKSVDTTGHLKVFMVAGELRYTDEGTKNRSSGAASRLPDNWIANLRADTAKLLQRLSTTQKPPPSASSRAVAERLRAAKELHDSGALTRDEYDAKRAEILKGL